MDSPASSTASWTSAPSETNGIILKGNVYNDQDGNGFRGGSEPGLSVWTVNLLDSSGDVLGSVLTDASGNYKFSGVGLDSSYQVAETVLAGWVQTQPLYPTVYSFTAQSGHNLNALNFGDHSAPALNALSAIDNGQAGYTETGTWYTSVGGLDGTNRIARTVQKGKATATATWDFTGLSSSATYDVYVTFGSKSQYSKAAPFTVYDGTTSLGTQSINESILVTMAQGGRAQGSYGGVGWLELGTYSLTGTELKVVLSNLTSTGSYVDADGVLLVAPRQRSALAAERGIDLECVRRIPRCGQLQDHLDLVNDKQDRSDHRPDYRPRRCFRSESNQRVLRKEQPAGRQPVIARCHRRGPRAWPHSR